MTAIQPKMAPKIARFLAEKRPATPCLVFDVDRVAQNFAAMRAAFPMARIFLRAEGQPGETDPATPGRAGRLLRCGEPGGN